MPQIDKVTFISTVYWIFVFYFFLYFDVMITSIYKYLSAKKLQVKFMLNTTKNMDKTAKYTETTTHVG